MQILSRSVSEVPVPFHLAKSIPSFGLNEDAGGLMMKGNSSSLHFQEHRQISSPPVYSDADSDRDSDKSGMGLN